MSSSSNREKDRSMTPLTRRQFLKVSGIAGAGALMAACAPRSAAPSAQAPTAEAPRATPLSATEAPAQATQPASTGGTLVYGAESMSETVEPGLWLGFGGMSVLDNVAEGLTSYDYEPGSQVKPGLAEKWDISSDGKAYTFYLRPGVKFHDDTPLTAEAVVRSLTRQTNPKDKSYREGLYMHTGYGSPNIESITAEGDNVVKLILKKPDSTQLFRLFHPSSYILSPAALDKYGPDIGKNPVGTGPFKLERLVANQEATLSAFDGYWGGRPGVNTLVVRGYPDEAALLAALEADEVQFTPNAPLTAIDRLKKDPRFKVEVGPPYVVLFLGLNARVPALATREARQAINYAINRDNIIIGALAGYAAPPSSILTPSALGYDPQYEQVSKQDVEKAKALLAQAGVKEGTELSLQYENNRFWPAIAELIKSDLEAVGLKVTLDKLDAGSFWGKVLGGEGQLSLNQRGTFIPDPNDLVIILRSSEATAQKQTANDTFLTAKELDGLIDRGVEEQDPEKRKDIYRQIQKLVMEEMPYVFLGYQTVPVVMSANIVNPPVFSASAQRPFFRKVALS